MSTAFEKIGTDRQLQDHWIRRLIAGIIDSIIIAIISGIIAFLVSLSALLLGGFFLLSAFSFLSGGLFLVYASFFESSRGTTIGKQIMNLKVTTTDGKLPSLDKTLIRNISKIHWVLWLIDTLLGMATVGDPHQKYSDRFAGTTVASTISTGLILPSSPSPPTPPSSA
jgi:uncharacterized RDD family membrane protein YckC